MARASELLNSIGITSANRGGVIDLLNKILADEFVLYTKTRKFHWNVISPSFSELHTFFGDQYDKLNTIVDDVAERIRALGGKSIGTTSEFSKISEISENPGNYPKDTEMLKILLDDQETVIRSIREAADVANSKFKDFGTNTFLGDLLIRHEKMAWMLRSFLENMGV